MGGVPTPTEDLHRVAGNLGGSAGHIALHKSHGQALMAPMIELPCGLIYHMAHVDELHFHIGEHFLHLLELGNALPEGSTLPRPLDSIVHGGLCQPQSGCASEDASILEEPEQLREAPSRTGQPPAFIQPHVIELDMRERKHLLADLVFRHRSDAGSGARDHPHGQRGMPADRRSILVDGGDKQCGSIFSVVDEQLLAVHRQLSVDGAHVRAHAHGVGTGGRLGNRESECQTPGILILHTDRIGLRRAGERFKDLQLQEVVLKR